MKKLFIIAIALLLITFAPVKLQAQQHDSVMSIKCDLQLDGIQNESNVFNIEIIDDDKSEVRFKTTEYFSCDLKLEHTYMIIIKSDNHTSDFITIDTNGHITKRLQYKFKSNLITYKSTADAIRLDSIVYSEQKDAFVKLN